ncbi:MAG: hypothetical protein J7J17_01595 [Hadesarchaea archaeon]|nr:hypothetical protein [Hadesarchaea archaeon]
MRPWQVIYIIGTIAGLLVGASTSPYTGVAFIWAFIIGAEALHYWLKERRAGRRLEAEPKP